MKPIRTRYLVAAALAAVAGSSAFAWSAMADTPVDESKLSPDERHTLYADQKQDAVARQREWLMDFLANGGDVSALEPVYSEAESVQPAATLGEAIDQTDLVIVGEVANVRYEFDPTGALYSIATVAISSQVKGRDLGLQIEIKQAGGPFLDDGHEEGGEPHAHVRMAAGNPLLYAGDRAVLFLAEPRPNEFFVKKFTGQYRLDGADRIQVPEGISNPFADSVNGRPVADFLALVNRPR